jgi:hypothetical protein
MKVSNELRIRAALPHKERAHLVPIVCKVRWAAEPIVALYNVAHPYAELSIPAPSELLKASLNN